MGGGAAQIHAEEEEEEKEIMNLDSSVSTASHDRTGVAKIKTWFPPSSYTDADDRDHTLSFTGRIWMTLENPAMGAVARIMSVIMMLLILASCVGFIMASMPSMNTTPSDAECEDLGSEMIIIDCETCFDVNDEYLPYGVCKSHCDGVIQGEAGEATMCAPTSLPVFEVIEAFW